MQQFAHPRVSTHAINAATLCVLATLSACMGSSGDGSEVGVPARSYALGATISGLNSSGLVLMVHARQRDDADLFQMVNQRMSSVREQIGNATAVSVAAGESTQGLVSSLPAGTSYSVIVQTQPTGETCTVGAVPARSNRRRVPMWR